VTAFQRSHQDLLCDGVSLASIADSVGTPVYVYSAAELRARYRALDAAFGAYPHSIHYALKANSSLALVRVLQQLGSGADANSIWEIDVARQAGILPAQNVFTGVGKTVAELECAVELGLKAINVESAGELDRIEAIAARTGRIARVAVRLNPDIDARSHPHISTGLRVNKFGIAPDAAAALFRSLPSRPALKLVAIHVHVGSQITSVEPLRHAAAFVAQVANELQQQAHALEYVDVGGGLGISYDDRAVIDARSYASALLDEIRPTKLPIVVEPGRSISGPAGVLVARVIDVKPRDAASDFIVIDAGMTELLRPALYNAFHRIEPVVLDDAPPRGYEIVGPVCETSDVVGRDRTLPAVAVGALLAIRDAGAYGAAMASNYNRRPLPAEVIVDDGGWRIARRRQTVADMIALEESSWPAC
jgi:diaminopimelate decarboxylase